MGSLLAAANIPADTTWTKSSFSGANSDNCVELAEVPGGALLRKSTEPELGAFPFSDREMTAFIDGAANGDFDRFRK